MKATSCCVEPWWARLYYHYMHKMPSHRGKSWALRQLLRVGLRRGEPFGWKMQNGNYVAISPQEGRASWSVGWTCFLKRKWEPHIEQLLHRFVRAGDAVMDIGANLGYFSTVLANLVGPTGKVWAFEPVPPTYRQLTLAREMNGLEQLVPFPYALGASHGEITICFREDMMGSASAHFRSDDAQTAAVTVPMRRLDDLLREGSVGLPALIKIDVEGHERDVMRGARELLSRAKPKIVFEFNAAAAASAGWNFAEFARTLRECADYRFHRILPGGMEQVEPAELQLPANDYADFLATVGETGLAS